MRYVAFAIPSLAMFVVSPASAQDLSGFRIEAQAGWSHFNLADLTRNTTARPSTDRFIYGIGAGYDHPIGHGLILGLDSNLDFGSGSSCRGGGVLAGDRVCGKLVRDVDVGARIGVQTGPALIYGRVAYANTLMRSTFSSGTGSITTASDSAGGLRLGAGAELGITPNIYAKAEYRFTTAGDFSDQHQVLTGIGFRF